MNGMNPTLTTIPDSPAKIHYPDGDGKPMAETPIHVLVMLALIGTLRQYFRHRSDVYVIGNIFLYYEEGHPESRRSPDVMIVKGVDPNKDRHSYKTWEERAVPSVILEITSRETAEEDQGPKRELYERLGVREYFLFDPLHEYLEQPLIGYRLIGDEYEPLPPAQDGGLLSGELGLRLVPEETHLALFRFRTGERLPLFSEAYEMVEQVRQHARETEERSRQVENELREERRRTQQLAEELARLRALLPPEQGGTGSPQG
jgi:Uma2 family endonuclease